MGGDKIRRLMAYVLNNSTASTHFVTNVQVKPIDNCEASSVCMVYAWFQRHDGTQFES